ncbi:MAG: hypothetical protein ABSB01_22465 [Streptosporangiaceae bacterium]|jgi:hypothetical protein
MEGWSSRPPGLGAAAHHPGSGHIAVSLGVVERSAYGIVTDLTAAGHVVKQKDGRRKPLPDPGAPPAANLLARNLPSG